VQRGTPVDLRLLCERRLLPALIGQAITRDHPRSLEITRDHRR